MQTHQKGGVMDIKNDDDDDIMIYDSSPSKAELWREVNKLRDRVRELEHELSKFKSDKYFGEK
jgi:hypothetical protein